MMRAYIGVHIAETFNCEFLGAGQYSNLKTARHLDRACPTSSPRRMLFGVYEHVAFVMSKTQPQRHIRQKITKVKETIVSLPYTGFRELCDQETSHKVSVYCSALKVWHGSRRRNEERDLFVSKSTEGAEHFYVKVEARRWSKCNESPWFPR